MYDELIKRKTIYLLDFFFVTKYIHKLDEAQIVTDVMMMVHLFYSVLDNFLELDALSSYRISLYQI